MNEQIYISKSVEETQKIAMSIAEKIQSGGVLLLKGDLGSGKTTFTQGFAKGLGITRRINSPTFIIMREYRIMNYESRIKNFYHLDLYRTETDRDLEGLGIEEIVQNSDNIVVIEWPEKLGELMPKHAKTITFNYLNETEREIIIHEN